MCLPPSPAANQLLPRAPRPGLGQALGTIKRKQDLPSRNSLQSLLGVGMGKLVTKTKAKTNPNILTLRSAIQTDLFFKSLLNTQNHKNVLLKEVFLEINNAHFPLLSSQPRMGSHSSRVTQQLNSRSWTRCPSRAPPPGPSLSYDPRGLCLYTLTSGTFHTQSWPLSIHFVF